MIINMEMMDFTSSGHRSCFLTNVSVVHNLTPLVYYITCRQKNMKC